MNSFLNVNDAVAKPNNAKETIESAIATIIGDIALRIAAKEARMTYIKMRSLPLNERRRYHDDTTVVVMFL